LLAVLEVRNPTRFEHLRAWPILALGIGLIVFGAVTSAVPVVIATGVGTALTMAWLLHHPLPWARALSFGGGASYALYLWHKDAFIAFGPLAGMLITLVAAGLSWALIERPILARVHALDARRRRGRTGQ